MKQLYKFKPKFFFKGVLTAVIFCTLTWKTAAIGTQRPEFRRALTSLGDTTKPVIKTDTSRRPTSTLDDSPRTSVADTTKNPLLDTNRVPRVDTFNLKISKDSLEAPLKYYAEDSVVVLIQDKKILMYGKTKTEYQKITLTAPEVEVDQKTQTVTAVNRKDSTGLVT